jgi:hypothetical protein
MGAELFRATDMMKLTVAFRNFANAPERCCPESLFVCYR